MFGESNCDDEFDWDPVDQFMWDELVDDTIEKNYFEVLRRESECSRNRKRRRKYIKRDREAAHVRLFEDYFSDEPIYPPSMFRQRFRMRKELFLRIVEALSNHSEYFRIRFDATGQKGLSPLQKCTAAIRHLAYGTSANHTDEYTRIGERTALDCMMNFCRSLIEVFANVYLRKPNANDVERLLEEHSKIHGFPGMLGSVDCMHWSWKNCPITWKGQNSRDDERIPTIMLEAVASHDLWIWHAFFGIAGSNKDINVLNESSCFNDVLQSYSQEVYFTVNETTYTKGYYLADEIYPEWATIVKSFTQPEDPKRLKFKQMQEVARKDVQRAIGVLQSRWAIVRGPSRSWNTETLKDIINACIILHNMIVEDEGNTISNWNDDEIDASTLGRRGSIQEFQRYLQRHAEPHDRDIHHQLQSDLVEHIWERFKADNK